MKSTSTPLFATPIYKTMCGNAEGLGSLKDYLLRQQSVKTFKNIDSPQPSPAGVFESHFNLFDIQAEEIQSLKEKLYQHLMQYLMEVNNCKASDLDQLSFKNESWVHITAKGGYFQTHNHPMAAVSMVYCVAPGEEGLDDKENGSFVMHDPRYNASMYIDPANHEIIRAYSFNGGRFRFKADELLIFPSYLYHTVEPYNGITPRITIAANFSFSYK
mgnify:CR=1 FL=1